MKKFITAVTGDFNIPEDWNEISFNQIDTSSEPEQECTQVQSPVSFHARLFQHRRHASTAIKSKHASPTAAGNKTVVSE
jgi:hypothetical protein